MGHGEDSGWGECQSSLEPNQKKKKSSAGRTSLIRVAGLPLGEDALEPVLEPWVGNGTEGRVGRGRVPLGVDHNILIVEEAALTAQFLKTEGAAERSSWLLFVVVDLGLTIVGKAE